LIEYILDHLLQSHFYISRVPSKATDSGAK